MVNGDVKRSFAVNFSLSNQKIGPAGITMTIIIAETMPAERHKRLAYKYSLLTFMKLGYAPGRRLLFWNIQKTPLNYSKISKYSEPQVFPELTVSNSPLFQIG